VPSPNSLAHTSLEPSFILTANTYPSSQQDNSTAKNKAENTDFTKPHHSYRPYSSYSPFLSDYRMHGLISSFSKEHPNILTPLPSQKLSLPDKRFQSFMYVFVLFSIVL
jgi:hypothetical protein